MRCTKCHKFLPLFTKFCQKCGQPVDPEKRKKSRRNLLLVCLIGYIIVTAIFFLLGSKYKSGAPENTYYNIAMITLTVLDFYFGVVLIIMLPVILIKKIIALFKYCYKHPKFLPIPLAIILIIGGAGYFYYDSIGDFIHGIFFSTVEDPIYLLQDNLTSAGAIKIYGDALKTAAPTAFTGKNDTVANTEQNIAQKITALQVSSKLAEYKKAATVWPGKIAQAADDLKTWSDLPKQPGDFNLTISSSKAKKYLEHTTEQLAVLKEFGDSAIKRGDRDAMAYLAAKLLVQDHWLNGLTHSKNSFFAQAFTPALAYAGDERKICYQVEKIDICADTVKQTIDDLYQSAYDYVLNKDKTAAAWTKAWNKTLNDTELTLAITVETAAGKEQAKYTPTVQTFVDDCYAKGGAINNTKPESNQLPTGESGYRCDYKSGTNNCWDWLTYTGSSYTGGGNGCLEINLIPKDIASSTKENNIKLTSLSVQWQKQEAVLQASAKPNLSQIKWDGTYSESGTLKCVCAIPDFPSSIPVNDDIKVVNNAVVDSTGKTAPINSQGQARLDSTTNSDFGNGITLKMVGQIYFQFSKSGNTLKFKASGKASGNISANGASVPINCTASAAGTKK